MRVYREKEKKLSEISASPNYAFNKTSVNEHYHFWIN